MHNSTLIAKLFTLLETLADSGSAVSLADLTRQVHLPKPTVYRLLNNLCELNYLTRDEKGCYARSACFFDLARNNGYEELIQQTRPVLEMLHEKLNETVTLAVLAKSTLVGIDHISTSHSLRPEPLTRVGNFGCETALGRAIISFLPAATRAEIIERIDYRQLRAKSIRNPRSLEDLIEKTRERGWAFDDDDCKCGVSCYGFPILRAGRAIASISISIPITRLDVAMDRRIVSAIEEVRNTVQPSKG